MAERVTIEVGSAYASGSLKVTVLETGVDDTGDFATLTVGERPDLTFTRLHIGETQTIPGLLVLRLAGIAPPGYTPAIALEVARDR